MLWTTHLVDEVKPDDRIIVLHEGRVLAADRAQAVMAAAGARTVSDAFARLTDRAEEADP